MMACCCVRDGFRLKVTVMVFSDILGLHASQLNSIIRKIPYIASAFEQTTIYLSIHIHPFTKPNKSRFRIPII